MKETVMKTMKKTIANIMLRLCPKVVISRNWKRKGMIIDWDNPKDINEKMLWLLINTDTSKWTELSDKYLVRNYLKECGLGDLLVKLYGKWDKAEDIDFSVLPQKSILKCNHDSGSYYIVDKTKGYDEKEIRKYLKKHLKVNYAYMNGELHYAKIKPCIIAEEFLEEKNNRFSSSLVDYKVWSFDGKPYCVWACHNRTKKGTYVNVYDLDWNVHPECSVFTNHYHDGGGKVPKPTSFDRMMEAASVLSKGFPEVRVDFYDVDGKLYFGEMTFTSNAANNNFFTKDFLIELGNQCVLPIK